MLHQASGESQAEVGEQLVSRVVEQAVPAMGVGSPEPGMPANHQTPALPYILQ